MDLNLQYKERGLKNIRVTLELEESKKREEVFSNAYAFLNWPTQAAIVTVPPISESPLTNINAPLKQNDTQGDVSMDGG